MAWDDKWISVDKIVFCLGFLWAFASAILGEYLKQLDN
jgi:hypothetical protein